MSLEASICVHVHAHDAPIQLDRCVSSIGKPYYRLSIGGLSGAVMFLDPHRIADLLAELKPMAERAAEDVEAIEEAA